MAFGNWASAVASAIEKVRQQVEVTHEMDTTFINAVPDRTEDLTTSGRAFRVPIEISIGGFAGQYSPDGGALGLGSGANTIVTTATPVALRFAVQITQASMAYTQGKEKAVQSFLARQLAGSMDQFEAFEDALLQTAGDNLIGTVASVSSNTMTMSAGFQHRLFYVGQKINVDSTDTTWTHSRGTATVTNINPSAGTVTVDVIPSGTTANDLVSIENPTTAISTSADAFTTVSNSTALLGLAYHVNDATTGTYMGQNRANYNALVSPSVDAASGTISRTMLRQAITAIKNANGIKAAQDLLVYGNIAQFDSYESLSMEIASIIKESPQGRTSSADLLMNQDQMKIGGYATVPSIHADSRKLFFLDRKSFGRATALPMGFLDVDGQTKFMPVSTSDGSPLAALLFYYVHHWQLFCTVPRRNAFIKNLIVPSGYLQ